VRDGVRDVVDQLGSLQSLARQQQEQSAAQAAAESAYDLISQRYKAGLASLVELEEARRTALAAETALIGLQRERTGAWIALYRAAGGGWSADTNALAPSTAARTTPVTAAATASASAAPAATRP
jgi:outer membrane protein TolC